MQKPHSMEYCKIDSGLSLLAYLVTHCPLPFIELSPANPGSHEESVRYDCERRIEWARAMLHAIYPAKANGETK